ncbi:MAG TPA: UDP-N-acetylmuramate--L-alanine ligase, partial [Spirochaetales bacterium]|nr:UDP-N-acetylmuramate--L-alanine ligase [Spirochaetales bacterium]
FPPDMRGLSVHLVGAKGSGVCALAELLVAAGATVSGSDVAEPFYTDRILTELGILVQPFGAANVQAGLHLVVHSAAYKPDAHSELLKARELGIQVLSYPQALGMLSASRSSAGVCGVHGNTTTTAIAGCIAEALGLPATILSASAVSSFGNRSTLHLGDKFFIAETCEYRRHFLNFHPQRILLTSVESDHQDYYPDYNSIRDAFVEYLNTLPANGTLVYCADDAGARDALSRMNAGPTVIPYGFTANGPYRIESYQVASGRAEFRLAGFSEAFSMQLPGRHLALNATGALALCMDMLSQAGIANEPALIHNVRTALASFAGTKRRSEIIGRAAGVLVMDDYAHHPSAIRTTLAGLREFHPNRRIVADFMSHTYSRTAALFDEFADSFSDADEVIMHAIYASARETPDTRIDGKALAEATAAHGAKVSYFDKPMDALAYLKSTLKADDLFITMGAGDNWQLGNALYAELQKIEGKQA